MSVQARSRLLTNLAVGSPVYSGRGSPSATLAISQLVLARSSSAVMAQILDPLPSESSGKILCCYVNATSQIQIVRITNISNWYFERVAFPGQRLVFEAVPAALMEIHTGMMASAILSDKIPCDRLQINEGPYSTINPPAVSTGATGSNQTRNARPKIREIPETLPLPVLTLID